MIERDGHIHMNCYILGAHWDCLHPWWFRQLDDGKARQPYGSS